MSAYADGEGSVVFADEATQTLFDLIHVAHRLLLQRQRVGRCVGRLKQRMYVLQRPSV
jgi:hypothetical protein